MSGPVFRWWLCPNGICPHGAILHDVEDYDDDTPTCCVEGCDCGKQRSATSVVGSPHPMLHMTPIDVAHAALLEAGRPDLADDIIGFEDEAGFYLEYDHAILDDHEWSFIDRAETLARRSVGLAPIVREHTT